jgi:hypothetical protein
MPENTLMNREGFCLMETETLLTREVLKQRWGVGLRMIDRLRAANKLPWIDVSAARGSRPTVRFRLRDIEDFEQQQRHSAAERPGPVGELDHAE